MALSSAAALVIVLATAHAARAAAGGGSFGFHGGGGGGGHGGGGFFIFLLLAHHPILIVILAAIVGTLAVFAWIQSARYRARRRERVRRVELAAAEASEDDAAFAPDVVLDQAKTLFRSVQAAWDRRDRPALAALLGPDLLVEWERRLDDFERKGWHNRVKVETGPAFEYVGLVNRAEDRDDRVVLRVEATLSDYVQDRSGRQITRDNRAVKTVALAEYWTLGKRDARWVLLSIEQQAEGDHNLSEELVATPWGDTGRLHEESVVENAAAGQLPDDVAVAEVAALDFAGNARAAALDLSLADARFGPDVIEVSVRRAVAAWTEAVDGDDAALLELASPEAARDLLHPGDASSKTRLVVRGPHVRELRIVELDAHAEPPTLMVEVDAEGRRYIEDRDTAQVLSGTPHSSTRFTETWALALTGADAQPWRIVDATARRAVV